VYVHYPLFLLRYNQLTFVAIYLATTWLQF
jgi:hypothetical protein